MSAINSAVEIQRPRYGSLTEWTRRHAVALFFVLAFALTWAIEIPLVLDDLNLLPFHLSPALQFLMGPMPGVAALLMAGLVSGKAGVLDLARRVFRWRVGLRWYVLALFGSAALYFAALALGVALGSPAPRIPPIGARLFLVFMLQLTVYLVFNWEDVAWRGFAAARLQATHSALVTALLLGVVEGLFHLPLFFSPHSSQSNSPFLVFVIGSIGGVIVLNWIFNSTRGSVLLPMLFHAAMNTWTDVASIPAGVALPWTLMSVLFVLAAAWIVFRYGAARLTRAPAQDYPAVVDPISR